MQYEIEQTERWLKSMFNVNKEIDIERENVDASLERIEKLEKEKEKFYKAIATMTNPTHKQLLHKRYVQGKKWEDVAAEMFYEEQHIHRLHKKAILELHKIRTGRV